MTKYFLQMPARKLPVRKLAQRALTLLLSLGVLASFSYSLNAIADSQATQTDQTKTICTSLNKNSLIKSNLSQSNILAIAIPTSNASAYASDMSIYVKYACCAYQNAIPATECQNNSFSQLFYATYHAQSIKQQQIFAALQAANN